MLYHTAGRIDNWLTKPAGACAALIGGLTKRGISLAQDAPPRIQLVPAWRTGFCPGESSPEAISVWTGILLLLLLCSGLVPGEQDFCVRLRSKKSKT